MRKVLHLTSVSPLPVDWGIVFFQFASRKQNNVSEGSQILCRNRRCLIVLCERRTAVWMQRICINDDINQTNPNQVADRSLQRAHAKMLTL